MLVLPTGQILFTNGATVGTFGFKGPASVEVYTGAGVPRVEWAPVISSAPGTMVLGSYNNVISGTQFNGLSGGSDYGDDALSATNYPLVRITNTATGHVFYARTHDHSTMGVQTGKKTVSTNFDVPSGMETGASKLEVVGNGIPSQPVSITVN